MRPVVVAVLGRWLGEWASWLVPTYPVMLALGCLLGAVRLVAAARRQGYVRRDTLGVVMVAYATGLLGAHLVPLGQGLWALATTGSFRARSGMAAYGGLLLGTLASGLWLRRRGLAVGPFLDAAAPSVGLGYFFARLGCFLAGCDYGSPTSLPWGVRFPAGSHAFRDHVSRGLVEPTAAWSQPVHSTQLYLAFVGLGLSLLCAARPARGDGRRFLLYVVGYALLRSLVELVRGDEGRGALGPLSTSQVLAVVSVALAAGLVAAPRRRPVG